MSGYETEMNAARDFIEKHKTDVTFMSYYEKIKDSSLMHSERWSLIYDFMAIHYPETRGAIVTGLVYLMES